MEHTSTSNYTDSPLPFGVYLALAAAVPFLSLLNNVLLAACRHDGAIPVALLGPALAAAALAPRFDCLPLATAAIEHGLQAKPLRDALLDLLLLCCVALALLLLPLLGLLPGALLRCQVRDLQQPGSSFLCLRAKQGAS